MRVTRPVMLCMMVFGLTTQARAGAFDWLGDSVLRGSQIVQPARPIYRPGTPTYTRWDGLYFGGQFGRTESGADFDVATSSLVAYLLRNDLVGNHVVGWEKLSKDTQMASTYGGFIGYNVQFEQAIVGVELNYNRIQAFHSSADSVRRSFGDDTGATTGHHFFYDATVSGNASVRLIDFGAVRGRAAVEFGRFLPYIFGGVAVGRGTVTRSATVTYTRTDIPDPTTPPDPPITPIPDFTMGPATRSDAATKVFFGYTAGLGVDIAVMPNVFVRGEWEYIQLSVNDISIHLNTVRAGLGFRF